MSNNLRISLFIFSIITLFVIFYLLKKEKLPVKYSMIWLISSIILMLVSIIPWSLESISEIIGFQTISNLVIAIILALLLMITMILTIIVSVQNKKITLLIQEISLLKDKKK